MKGRPLPIGIDDFAKLREGGYYYVDKTAFIGELWRNRGEVNLFTRPRRFGKTLNMSMLQYFFEDTGDEKTNERNRSLFEGLAVMEDGPAILGQMGRRPVISLSLKSAKQPDWELAYACIREEIAREYKRHLKAADSIVLAGDRQRFLDLADRRGSREDEVTALRFLSECLYQASGEKAVILIDEYDVPLENAYFGGFYERMSAFIRSLFESALKTNPALEFAAVTGCLRISRESIFTGLNNLNVCSIISDSYGEHFGFLQAEVDEMLDAYGFSDKREIMSRWYDGYVFGGQEVYNPWSAVNYVSSLTFNPQALPKPYWSNTSSNSIVRELVGRADMGAKRELEELLAGGTIEKPVHEEITYDSMYASQDNLWNFLFFTGYLKKTGERMEENAARISLAIPNAEVKYIYENTIKNWFMEDVGKRDLSGLYQALFTGNAEETEKNLSILLRQTISYMDSGEAFYHGFLLGVLGGLAEHVVRSNREAGNGRLDICVYSMDTEQPPLILELKASPSFGAMEASCQQALAQIEEKAYDAWLPQEGYREAWLYGIAFYKKQCRVKVRHKFYVTV